MDVTCEEEGGGTRTGPEEGGLGPSHGVGVGEACWQGPRWPDPTLSPSENPAGGTQDRGMRGSFGILRGKEETNTFWNYRANPRLQLQGRVSAHSTWHSFYF